jgi:hypothetical protein
MHKVRGNNNSCRGRSSENICSSSSGGAQGKGAKQDETQFTTKKWCIFEFHQVVVVVVGSSSITSQV